MDGIFESSSCEIDQPADNVFTCKDRKIGYISTNGSSSSDVYRPLVENISDSDK